MTNKLELLNWKPKWVSILGCIKGSLDYLDVDVSDGWLFGATGHAFIMNMHEVVCPSGPTAWNSSKIHELGKNVGYEVSSIYSDKFQPDFEETRKKCWDFARK